MKRIQRPQDNMRGDDVKSLLSKILNELVIMNSHLLQRPISSNVDDGFVDLPGCNKKSSSDFVGLPDMIDDEVPDIQDVGEISGQFGAADLAVDHKAAQGEKEEEMNLTAMQLLMKEEENFKS